MLVSVFFGGCLVLFLYVYEYLIMKPKRQRSKLEKQGIRGPCPSIFLGNIPEIKNIHLKLHSKSTETAIEAHHEQEQEQPIISNNISHDWPSTIFPHLKQWQTQYGPVFMYSTGSIQILCITDAEMVKEVSLCTSLNLGKPSYLSKDRGPLLGQGILATSGSIWAHQRKIIAPELYLDKVKSMVNLMVDSTTSLLESWESRIKSEGEIADINIDQDLRSLSADIISRACFGSNFSQGKQIFSKIRNLQKVMSNQTIGVPGSRYMPNKSNKEMWRLEKEIKSMILSVVKHRVEASYERDLLQMILESAKNYSDGDSLTLGITRDKFIVDNCKNIYFAGHETTAIAASWSLMLLAANPEWQDRARAEVLEICRDGVPNADMLQSMKTLTMVIQETLRLYPPAVFVGREALEDMKLKNILVPKGVNIQIPISMLHQNPHIWGPDSHKYNPERFQNGVLEASKIPHAYIPFGLGNRVCAGQHLAMIELKVILSLILSKFCFSLSPAYQHCPAFRLVIEPKDGVRLHMRRLQLW
ncbi:cytochrome P450 714C2-like [Ziziphus jujuba]|uniref:Cytochrome P450 714C2-like n=1 Tax=Ziziphus jujuba TaxID=326968 RepID=A0A6P3ZWF9_ZIZJJ|nr:cytochrome P450 714C2-like [Ziziphus jujuba]